MVANYKLRLLFSLEGSQQHVKGCESIEGKTIKVMKFHLLQHCKPRALWEHRGDVCMAKAAFLVLGEELITAAMYVTLLLHTGEI